MYDNVTRKQRLSESSIERENKHIYNNSLMIAPTNETDSDGNTLYKVVAPFDCATEGMMMTDHISVLTVRGQVYQLGTVLEIPVGETYYIYATTPADKTIQMTPRTTIISSINGANQPARVRTRLYYEGDASGGTVIPKFNKNHNRTAELDFDLYNLEDTEPADLGIELPLGRFLTAEVGATRVEGERSGFVMKRDSTYILSVTNRSQNNAVRVQLYWEFYEIDL